jgi:integrase
MAHIRKIKIKSGTAHRVYWSKHGVQYSQYFPPGVSFADVRSFARKMDADSRSTIDPPAMTLHQFFSVYLEARANEIDTSRHDLAARNYLRRNDGFTPAGSTTWEHIHKYRDRLLAERGDTERHRRGVNKELQNLRTIFNWMARRNYIEHSPFDKVTFLPATVPLPPALTRDQARALYRALPRGRMRLAFKIMTYTGLRRGEVVRLRWEDVDFGSGYLRLGRTKNGEEALVPLHPHLHRILRRCASSGPVIGFRADSLTHAFRRALNKAGMRHLASSVHIMRHTFAVTIMEQETPDAGERMAMEMLRHHNSQMTRHYARIAKSRLKEKLARMKF